LNGGAGTDTAVYQDAPSNYTITAPVDGHGMVTRFTQVQETGPERRARRHRHAVEHRAADVPETERRATPRTT